jgi:hypothetical protein
MSRPGAVMGRTERWLRTHVGDDEAAAKGAWSRTLAFLDGLPPNPLHA